MQPDPSDTTRPAAHRPDLWGGTVLRRRASVALRVLAAVVMCAALAAMFVPDDPDPLVVIYLAAPSFTLALASNLLDGRNPLTGDPRRGRRPPAG